MWSQQTSRRLPKLALSKFVTTKTTKWRLGLTKGGSTQSSNPDFNVKFYENNNHHVCRSDKSSVWIAWWWFGLQNKSVGSARPLESRIQTIHQSRVEVFEGACFFVEGFIVSFVFCHSLFTRLTGKTLKRAKIDKGHFKAGAYVCALVGLNTLRRRVPTQTH